MLQKYTFSDQHTLPIDLKLDLVWHIDPIYTIVNLKFKRGLGGMAFRSLPGSLYSNQLMTEILRRD